ncbi:conjugative transfer protein MobI(A/C) [Vreelandella zhanjiangensis]|uniref:conjugative transfer protein MobI(A/C) n=1 Tax=Vreelandella zhanjiangensis TaxID=1121960 RepID=UPI00402AB4EA
MINDTELYKLLSELLYEFSEMRIYIEKYSDLLCEEAMLIRDDFRKLRDEFKKGEGKHKYWVHDVRIKKTKNGVCIEWFFYKSRHGDFSISENIPSNGLLQMPSASFKKCSRYEKNCIKEAEQRFSKLRQITRHLSSVSLAISSLNQMKSATYNKIVDNAEPLMGICPPECDCETPCESLLMAQSMYGWGA